MIYRCLMALVCLCCTVMTLAYDNDGRDAQGTGLIKGGPHRTLNELAIAQWLRTSEDPRVRQYTPLDDYELLGSTVVEPGLEIVTTAERTGTLRWWVIEGGYTADEPELYNSFRHFYDPISLDGVPYLTDHITGLDYAYRVFVWGTKPGKVVGVIAGSSFNPEVNARDWAITGEANKGWGKNDYCWNRGIAYMQAAFGEANGRKKQLLFAQAWRALGETMHLMSDMTCVPHVRNDSHPGKAIGYGRIGNTDPNQGALKNDPYELLTTEQIVRDSAPASLDPDAKRAIDGAADPYTLFDKIARYTQERFFSADTIGGAYIKDRGKPTQRTITVTPGNGEKTYPLPVLAKCQFNEQTGYFTSVIHGRPVLMCHETWLSSIGWGDPSKNGPQISKACVYDQAKILIPVAIAANAKLADWFVPRLEVAITDVNANDKTLSGTLSHLPYGAYKTTMPYTQGQGQVFRLWVNNKVIDPGAYLLAIANGKITGELEGLALKQGDRVAIGVGIGGLLVRSADFLVNVGAVQKDCWVLDRVVSEKQIPKDSGVTWRKETITVSLGEVNASVSYHEVVEAINGYTFDVGSAHAWSKPPKMMKPEEKVPLRIEAQITKWALSNTEGTRHDWWASTQVHASLTPTREVQEQAKRNGVDAPRGTVVGYDSISAGKDIARPERTLMQATKDFTFTMPFCYAPGYELAIAFSCGYGYTIYYYRWTGTFPEPANTPDTEGCVTAGTLVTLANGHRVPIEHMAPGDQIAAVDQTTREQCVATVERVLVHRDGPFKTQLLTIKTGQSLTVTGNHPILTRDNGWMPVEQLTPGTVIYCWNSTTGRVEETTVIGIIRDQGQHAIVYNLQTSQGDYFANDILVHNKCVAAGSWIDTPDGPCPVEHLRIGQLVYGQAHGQRIATPVTHLYTKVTVLPVLPGKRISPRIAVTANHMVHVNGAFQPAATLPLGDEGIAGMVYDLQTAAGNYYADGVLMMSNE